MAGTCRPGFPAGASPSCIQACWLATGRWLPSPSHHAQLQVYPGDEVRLVAADPLVVCFEPQLELIHLEARQAACRGLALHGTTRHGSSGWVGG